MGMQALMMVLAGFMGVVDRPLPKKDVAKDDAKLLQGTWRVTLLQSRGRPFPEERLRQLDYKLIIQGQEFYFMLQNRKTQGMQFKVDPASKPKAIDLTPMTGRGKGQTILAIYSLEGDTLRICQPIRGGKRPSDFISSVGTRQNVMILKREKPLQ